MKVELAKVKCSRGEGAGAGRAVGHQLWQSHPLDALLLLVILPARAPCDTAACGRRRHVPSFTMLSAARCMHAHAPMHLQGGRVRRRGSLFPVLQELRVQPQADEEDVGKQRCNLQS